MTFTEWAILELVSVVLIGAKLVEGCQTLATLLDRRYAQISACIFALWHDCGRSSAPTHGVFASRDGVECGPQFCETAQFIFEGRRLMVGRGTWSL